MAVTPIILSPYDGLSFSTNRIDQIISGTASAGTTAIYVNGTDIGSDFNITDLTWSYEYELVDGANPFSIQAYDGSALSVAAPITITFLPGDTFDLVLNPPVGLTTRAYNNKIEIVLDAIEQTLAGFTGQRSFNVYYSTTPGIGYLKLNGSPLSVPNELQRRLVNTTRERLPDATVTTLFGQAGNYDIESYVTKDAYEDVSRYIFSHDANTPTVPLDTSLTAYYVMTSLFFDTVNRVEIESRFSDEVATATLNIDATVRTLPNKPFDEIAADYINFVYDTDPELDQTPGTVVRDIYVEPFANEMEKLRFIEIHRSHISSFLTLRGVDDANGDGISDPVDQSEYKLKMRIAFGLQDNPSTQAYIDESFDKLAANYGVTRTDASQAQGYVTFRTTDMKSDVVATKDGVVGTKGDASLGTSPVFFRLQTYGTMLISNKADYYNPTTGYYEMRIPILADIAGTTGNVSAGEINTIVSGVTGIISVINIDDTRFGDDRESNSDLADRCQFAIVGVDSGTAGGYIFDSLAVPGVRHVSVIGGGDPLMVRDVIDGEHVYGTVDIYVQGSLDSQATDTFSFLYPVQESEIFKLESRVFYQIASLNPNVNIDNPIFTVSRVYNATREAEYDLTGMILIGGTIIDLDEFNLTNSTIGICDTDVIRVDYTYRIKSKFVLNSQPVNRIISVVGDLSGDLSDNYNFIRASHPLFEGNSSRAGDYIEIFNYNSKPSGVLQSVSDTLLMLEEFPVGLSKVGVLEISIDVLSPDLLTTYVKDVDYELLAPTSETAPYRVRRMSTGSIPNATDVVIQYQCGENITITYEYNALPLSVLNALTDKHIDADVLVKAVNEPAVDVDATVVKPSTLDVGVVDKRIRQNISKYFSDLKIGNSIYESDIIAVIDDTTGVDFVLVPLRKLSRADDNMILDEQVSANLWIPSVTDLVPSWITSASVLNFLTTDKGGMYRYFGDGGGYEKRIVGVRILDQLYIQQDTEAAVARGAGRCYVRSDGKVVLSTHDGSNPNGQIYFVTYFTEGETGSKNIFAANNERFKLGTLNLRVVNNTGSTSG